MNWYILDSETGEMVFLSRVPWEFIERLADSIDAWIWELENI